MRIDLSNKKTMQDASYSTASLVSVKNHRVEQPAKSPSSSLVPIKKKPSTTITRAKKRKQNHQMSTKNTIMSPKQANKQKAKTAKVVLEKIVLQRYPKTAQMRDIRLANCAKIQQVEPVDQEKKRRRKR